jgi:hypothetical protein
MLGRVLKISAAVIGVIAAVLFIIPLTKPDTFRVERSTVINRSPEDIAGLVGDFRQWRTWSPYEKYGKQIDPDLKRSFSGAEKGEGSVYSWESGKGVKAAMEIVKMSPAEGVKIRLDYFKPVEAHNTSEFIFEPQAPGATKVTWAVYGKNPYSARFSQTFFSLDSVIGKDYEEGLAALKSVAEGTQAPTPG